MRNQTTPEQKRGYIHQMSLVHIWNRKPEETQRLKGPTEQSLT